MTGKNDIGGMSNFPSHLSQPSRWGNCLFTKARMQGCKTLRTLHPCTLPSALFHPVFAPVGRFVGGERRSGVPSPPRAVSRTRRGTWGFPASAGIGVRSDDGQHRVCLVIGTAAALPFAICGAMPHTPKLRAFLWKRFIRLRRRSFKGGPVPLWGTPCSPRERKKSFQKGNSL